METLQNDQEDLKACQEWITKIGNIFNYFDVAIDFLTRYEDLIIPFDQERVNYKINEKKKFSHNDLIVNDLLKEGELCQNLANLSDLYEKLGVWNLICPNLESLDERQKKDMSFLLKYLFRTLFLIVEEFKHVLLAKIGSIKEDIFEKTYFPLEFHRFREHLYFMVKKFTLFKK